MESEDYRRVKVVNIQRETSAQKVGHRVNIYRQASLCTAVHSQSTDGLWKTLAAMIGLVLLCWLVWELNR